MFKTEVLLKESIFIASLTSTASTSAAGLFVRSVMIISSSMRATAAWSVRLVINHLRDSLVPAGGCRASGRSPPLPAIVPGALSLYYRGRS